MERCASTWIGASAPWRTTPSYEAADLAVGPFVSALPDTDYTYPRLIVSVKGSNNGTFYLASPVELPSLRGYLTATIDGPSRPNWREEDEW